MILLSAGQLLKIKQRSEGIITVGGIPPDFSFNIPVDLIVSIIYITNGRFENAATVECLIALKTGCIKRGWLWENELDIIELDIID